MPLDPDPLDLDSQKMLATASPGEHRPEHVLRMDTPVGGLALHWQGAWSAEQAPAAGALIRVILAAAGADAGAVTAAAPPPWLAAPFTAYFREPTRRIDLPVQLRGTPFQRRAWQLIAAIPPGATRTYGELAADLGSSARAVGGACRANPCPLVVPCHRVVARRGLGGFAGDRNGRLRDIKRWLLAHEGVSITA